MVPLLRYSRSMNQLKLFLSVPGVIILAVGAVFAIGFDSTTFGDQDEGRNGKGKGLVSVVSAHSVDQTSQRLQDIISDAGFVIPIVIDHSTNAANVGKELRPTKLIIFGNPNVGTTLMQNTQTVGIDLPQKFLVWEDANGTVRITYNDHDFVAGRHQITDKELKDTLDNISNALNNFATAAAQ
jgi:uncharacterized protein (DUF302 family)